MAVAAAAEFTQIPAVFINLRFFHSRQRISVRTQVAGQQPDGHCQGRSQHHPTAPSCVLAN